MEGTFAMAAVRSKSTSNQRMAQLLRQYAALLNLTQNNRFKVNAYRRVADSLESSATQIVDLIAQQQNLSELPGVGKAIAGILQEISATGDFAALHKLRATLSPSLQELADYPRLDP